MIQKRRDCMALACANHSAASKYMYIHTCTCTYIHVHIYMYIYTCTCTYYNLPLLGVFGQLPPAAVASKPQ